MKNTRHHTTDHDVLFPIPCSVTFPEDKN